MFGKKIDLVYRNKLIVKTHGSKIYETCCADSILEKCKCNCPDKKTLVCFVKENLTSATCVIKASIYASIEKGILELLEPKHQKYIVELVGFSIGITENCLLIPKAKSDLSNIHRPINKKQIEYFTSAFENILSFLKQNKITYNDWKPSNWLVYQESDNEETYKLTDFGSCLKSDIKVKHPNNINYAFCSPFLMNTHENCEIVPHHSDDIIGVAYLFLWFLGYDVPWIKLTPVQGKDVYDFLGHVFDLKTCQNLHCIPFDDFDDLPTLYKQVLDELYIVKQL